jgi:hypothetical protein
MNANEGGCIANAQTLLDNQPWRRLLIRSRRLLISITPSGTTTRKPTCCSVLGKSRYVKRGQVRRRGEPNARNETRGSFARVSRCRGYITRVLTRVMTPIHQDVSATTAWPRAAHECRGSHFLTVSCVSLYYGHTIFTYISLVYTWESLSYTLRESLTHGENPFHPL